MNDVGNKFLSTSYLIV